MVQLKFNFNSTKVISAIPATEYQCLQRINEKTLGQGSHTQTQQVPCTLLSSRPLFLIQIGCWLSLPLGIEHHTKLIF